MQQCTRGMCCPAACGTVRIGALRKHSAFHASTHAALPFTANANAAFCMLHTPGCEIPQLRKGSVPAFHVPGASVRACVNSRAFGNASEAEPVQHGSPSSSPFDRPSPSESALHSVSVHSCPAAENALPASPKFGIRSRNDARDLNAVSQLDALHRVSGSSRHVHKCDSLKRRQCRCAQHY